MDDEEADHHYRAWRWAHIAGAAADVATGSRRPSTATGNRGQGALVTSFRDYLYPIVALRIRGIALPGPAAAAVGGIALLITTGFLPQRFHATAARCGCRGTRQAAAL